MRRSSGGGPHFPFCRHVASSHIRCLCSFCCSKWFPNFGSKPFSGCLTESHRDPAGSTGGPSYPRRDTRFDFERCNRSNKRCSESLFVSNFRYPQEIRGSSSNFESQGVQSVHFHSALPDGTLSVILPQLSASDWAVSIDLKDAYLHIPIHPLSRRFLGFQFLGRTFQYKVLPFGLKDSPWVFTRVVATLVGHLRQLGLRLFYYLDDWLLVAESRDLLESHLRTTLLWTRDLGFLVNWEKSSLTPQRLPSYLGAHLDIPRLLARPSEHRVLALQEVIRDLTKGPLAPALLWQKFLGHLASFVDLVPNCRLLMRPLQLHLLRYFTPLIDSQDKLVPLSPEIKVLCVAWASPSRLLEGSRLLLLPRRWSSPRTRQVRGGGRFFTLTMCQGFGRRRRPWIISILWN